jgi:hypothetical protein
MKRTVFLALALFALMAVGLYAQTEADFGVSKSADGKSITIKEYNGKATAVIIPAKIQNLPVTEIRGAFYLNSEITSVTIPNTVTKIGDQAFYLCTSLTSVTFQGTIPASGFADNAFGSGKITLGDIRDKYLAAGGGAGTYTRPDTNSTTWTKGASATVAPAAAGTPGLEYKLTSDGKGYSVSKGTIHPTSTNDVVIPASYNNLPVTTIANMAFNSCPGIRSVTIPASVTSISQAAFVDCIALNSVTFGGANTVFYDTAFPDGDLSQKYKAGKAGTYTRPAGGKTWTKK